VVTRDPPNMGKTVYRFRFCVCDCTGSLTFTVVCGGLIWLSALLGLFLELRRSIATRLRLVPRWLPFHNETCRISWRAPDLLSVVYCCASPSNKIIIQLNNSWS
jgi:hypothetical protein